MKKIRTTSFLIIAIMSVFWAFTIIYTLITEFPGNITYIDLATLFVLGIISGVTLILAFLPLRKSSGRR